MEEVTRRTLGFSVAIPALGQSEFLPTALSSLRSQRAPVELAVLDASPDDRVQRVLREQGATVAYGYHHPDGRFIELPFLSCVNQVPPGQRSDTFVAISCQSYDCTTSLLSHQM